MSVSERDATRLTESIATCEASSRVAALAGGKQTHLLATV